VEVSRQAIDFGALNGAMLTQDLFRKYAQKLDYQTLNGSGNSGQHKGVLNATGTNAISGTAVTSYKDFWEKVAAAKTAVHKSFVGNATHIVMNSDLYGWLVARTDSEGRPLLAFPGSAPQNVGGSEGIFNGLTVVVDDNIPSTSNGSLNPLQKAIVTNAKELFLFEQNGGTPLTISVDQVGATALKVAFVAYGYSAFTAERYPKATSIISGLALA